VKTIDVPHHTFKQFSVWGESFVELLGTALYCVGFLNLRKQQQKLRFVSSWFYIPSFSYDVDDRDKIFKNLLQFLLINRLYRQAIIDLNFLSLVH